MVKRKSDWAPRSEAVLRDQRSAYDAMRECCPVAWSEYMQWSVFRHEDVARIVNDHETFSNAVSRHLSVPNGMDPPEHTRFRALIEPYFTDARVRAFEPECCQVAADLVDAVIGRDVELMSELALPFAVRIQCAFMGWPTSFHRRLIEWNRKNHRATLAGDRAATAAIAAEFQEMVDEMIRERRGAVRESAGDVMTSLLEERVDGRPLDNAEIASILRNWTVGEIGTISAAVGILAEHLASDPALQARLREEPALLPPAIDEILRIHGPLVANRRVATRDVTIGGRAIRKGERISLIWIAANRDNRVFDDAGHVRLDRDASRNLLYGDGIHVCPGAGLARMELRVMMDTLLSRIGDIRITAGESPEPAIFPASGFATLPMTLTASAGGRHGGNGYSAQADA